MTRSNFSLALGLASMLASSSFAQTTPKPPPTTPTAQTAPDQMPPEMVAFIKNWPAESRAAAELLFKKYGVPDGVTQEMLVWTDTAPFKRTTVFKEPFDHDFPAPHKDVIEQVIDYKVPVDKFDDVAKLSGSLVANRTTGELASSAPSEALNILALNLADQVVRGTRSVDNARAFLADTTVALGRGERPRETTLLLVDVTRKDTGDKDKPARAASR